MKNRRVAKQVSPQYNFFSKNRRGQVTIFVIIAILIVASVGVYFLVRDKEAGVGEVYFLDTDEIYVFVQECLEGVSEEVIETVGQGGGYYFPPEKSTDFGITYYLINGRSYIPSKEKIGEEISEYISQKLFFCTKSFVDFPEYEIQQNEIKVYSEILDEVVLIEVDYPIFISKENVSSEINEFETVVSVKIGKIYSFIEEISEKEIKNQGVCLTCYLDKAGEEFEIELFDYEDSIVFIWKDKNLKINGENFEWVYANEY
jgi:hypothetical protein